MILGI